MPFMVIATDKPNTAVLRDEIRPKHISYLEAQLTKLIAAGAKMSDDGQTAIGTLYLIDTDDRAQAEHFVAQDPFTKAGVFGEIVAARWRKAIFDHASLIPKEWQREAEK